MAPTDPTQPIAAPKPRRWLRRLFGAVAVVTVVVVAVHFVVLPMVVRYNAAKAFDALGLTGATFDVRRATPWGSTLTNVVASGGDVRVNSIEAAYGPIRIMAGRLERITVHGATVRVVVRDGKPVLPIQRPAPTTSPTPTSPPSAAPPPTPATPEALPFHILELAQSAIVVDIDGQPVRIPVETTVEDKGGGQIAIRAKLGIDGPLGGELALPGDAGAKLRAAAGVSLLDATVDATLIRSANGLSWRATGRVGSDSPMTLSLPGAEIDIPHALVTADAAGEPGALPTVRADVAVSGAGVRHESSGLQLADVALSVPVSMNTTAAAGTMPAGSISIGSATLKGRKLEPLTGTVAVRDGRADFSAAWAALPASMLTVNGWLAPGDEGASGEINAIVPAFMLEDGNALAQLVPAMEGWTLSGELSADAKLSLKRGLPSGRVALTMNNATVASKPRDAELRGVTGAVTLDLTDGVASTPPGQRFTIASAALGETAEIRESTVAFSLAFPDTLLIEELSAGWLGGRVSTKNVRINPSEPKFEATVITDRLSLKELLALIAPDRAAGDGLMSGPVRARFDGENFTLLGGQLRSASATGELQVLDTRWLGETMDASDPRFKADRELAVAKQRILEALADFEYDRLTFEIAEEPAAGGRLSVNTHGKGRAKTAGQRPQELDLTLNFRGVNDVLNEGLKLGQWWQRVTNPEIGR